MDKNLVLRLFTSHCKLLYDCYKYLLEKSFLATPNVENKCWTLHEILESTGEMKRRMRFYLRLHNFSEFWNLFSLVPMGNCFRCYFRQLFISLALRKCIKDCKILKIILVPDFCPLKTETARFPIGFRLNCDKIPEQKYRKYCKAHSDSGPTWSTFVFQREMHGRARFASFNRY